MNATQAENLRILIRHMETKVTRTLDMSMFLNRGAPACALGEAVFCQELAHLGVKEQRIDLSVTGRHFAQTSGDLLALFGPAGMNAWGRVNVTPQEWAIEARKVLAENGYSMDDGFAAFKAKILAASYAFNVGEKGYPGEWIEVGDDPQCTAFVEDVGQKWPPDTTPYELEAAGQQRLVP